MHSHYSYNTLHYWTLMDNCYKLSDTIKQEFNNGNTRELETRRKKMIQNEMPHWDTKKIQVEPDTWIWNGWEVKLSSINKTLGELNTRTYKQNTKKSWLVFLSYLS